MNIWEILKIPETKDQNTIRKAYAKQAECFHPEEHPEEFLLIPDAYKQELLFARKNSGENTKAETVRKADTKATDENEFADNNILQSTEKSRKRFQFCDNSSDSLLEKYLTHPEVKSFKKLYISNKRHDRKAWESYFMSAEFLSVARDEGFTRALSQIVEEHLSEFPPTKEFQTMLAIAYSYRTILNQNQVKFQLEQGCVFREIDSIYAIMSKGALVRKLRGNDLVLLSGFQDYWYLNSFVLAEKWDDVALSELGRVLNCYSMAYLKDKCKSDVRNDHQRNPGSIRLLEYYFEHNSLPDAAYQLLWDKFNLKSVVMGRTKIFYGRLREIVLEKLPQVCNEKEECFIEVHRAFLAYVSTCYRRRYEKSLETDKRDTDAFFKREDLKRALNNQKFAEETILRLWINEDLCFCFWERLAACYKVNPELPFADRVMEQITCILERKQNIVELEKDAEAEISIESLTVYHRPFLRYFINNAFFYAKSEEKSEALFDYLTDCFPVSDEWSKKLAGLFQNEMSEREPFRKSYILKGEKGGNERFLDGKIDLLFHQYYIEYFFNGEPVYNPFLPFEQISDIKDDDTFFMLLPVSAAYEDSFLKVKQEVEKRLGRLPFPEENITFTANCIASYVCCMFTTWSPLEPFIIKEQRWKGAPHTLINRPMTIWRETGDRAYACEWYRNGQLYVMERVDKQYRFIPDSRYENIVSVGAAVELSFQLLDQLTAPGNFSALILRKYPNILYVESADRTPYTIEGEEVTRESVALVIRQFMDNRLNRLEIHWEQDKYSLVFIRDEKKYACLFFHDGKKCWYSLLSLPKMYTHMDNKDIVQVPFLLGTLPAYSVHQNTELIAKLIPSILSDLSLGTADLEQRLRQNKLWASKVYLNSAEVRYLFAKRTLGGFPPQRARNSIRTKFVLSRQPQALWYISTEGKEAREMITAVNNRKVQELLISFVMNRLNRLVLMWKMGQSNEPKNDWLHLMLLHEPLEEQHRYAAIVLKDYKQIIQYLVGDVAAYLHTEEKIPEVEFMGERIPFCLVHTDLVRIRDFLDLFLLSFPNIEAITTQFGEFASGAQLLCGMNYSRFKEEAFCPIR